MDPNQIQVEQIRYYVNMLDFAFVSILRLFFLTIGVYFLILHIQFAVAWFARHKAPEGLKYIAFIKSKLKRKRIWAALIIIPVCIAVFLWWGLSRYGLGFIMGPGPGMQVITLALEADRFIVRPSGDCLGLPDNKDKVFETTDPNEIREFVKLLSFSPTWKGMHCNCGGELGFEFYKNNEITLAFSLHHGERIRIRKQSDGDIFLSDEAERALDNWLMEKGIWQRQKEWEKSRPDIYDEDYKVQRDSVKTPVDPNLNTDMANDAATQRLKVLGETMKAKDITKIRELIKAGADVNVRTQEGFVPLYIASKKNYIEIVKILLDAGANVNAVSERFGDTPLMAASWLGHFELVTLLLAAGADVNISGDDGQTPLMAAANGGYIEIVKLLLKANANVNVRDNHGGTALLSASSSGYTEVIRLLLQAGADVNFAGSNSATPLFAASFSGHAEVVKLLLEAKARVNITAIGGLTPLIVASSGGHAEVVKLLLEAGADVNAVMPVDNANYSALDMAKKTGHNEVISLLKKYGAKE